jgi:hypothetical protein
MNYMINIIHILTASRQSIDRASTAKIARDGSTRLKADAAERLDERENPSLTRQHRSEISAILYGALGKIVRDEAIAWRRAQGGGA